MKLNKKLNFIIMKNMILLMGILLTIAGCSKEEEIAQEETTIFGTWQLVEQIVGNVGNQGNWEDIENGYTIEFDNNQNYNSTSSPICPSNASNSGTYSIENNEKESFLKIILDCDENENGTFIMEYTFSFLDNFLILSPTFSCDEGCAYKYIKIEDIKE